MIKKDIYELFRIKGIYLPTQQLEIITAEIKSQNKNVFAAIDEVMKRPEIAELNNDLYGAYEEIDQDKCVVAIDEVGNETKYRSPESAIRLLGKNPKGALNIIRAIKKGGTAYGYKWKQNKTK